MNQNDIEARAREFIHALHALEKGDESDVEHLVGLYADEAVLHNSALDNKGTQVEGRNEIRRFWTEYKQTLGDVYSKFHQIMANERAAGLFWTTHGHNPSDDEVHYHGATMLEFDDQGLITQFRGYYDTRELTVKKR